MSDHVLLGSTIRVDFGTSVKEGVLVKRQNQDPNLAVRFTIETGRFEDEISSSSTSISFNAETETYEVLSPPPRGSMLVVFGVGTLSERVRHVSPSRLAALDWLADHRPDWIEHGDIVVVPAHADEPRWQNPVTLALVPTRLSESFADMPKGVTGIPYGDAHPGAFGFRRRKHVHEGVDLYCTEGTDVSTVECGTVVSVIAFTGTIAEPPSPWWNDTWAVLVEGASGVVVYGEIDQVEVAVGDLVDACTVVGKVRRVMTKDNGRPLDMTHLELHAPGTRDAYEWTLEGPRPPSLLDPTEMLLSIALDDDRERTTTL